ncbi:hypothetical protein [Mycolicibacterium moriokaense]|uniref:Uncharacterized protein n=1 Tax=Mycolicibacterium moriokaense TaxID=39691 RepID=A0AAD1HG32_9MYCO|nr:hypothetical protein [Mycolicibacterium moriokaense]MCV7037346.1 hypothetical protein [Mycolicibacterium moriokaense]BBX04304.1 hypothetical protein MMOR_52400 [Mycolicibacterium moriokaense]
MDDNEVVSIEDAARECGVSVEVFVDWLIRDGMVLRHPEDPDRYIPGPHPSIQPLG